MLKKIVLENWKSFRYAELPIDPLTILIGTNASGKSNAIEALELLELTARDVPIERALMSIRGGLDRAAFCGAPSFSISASLQDNIAQENQLLGKDYWYGISVEYRHLVGLREFHKCLREIEDSDNPGKVLKESRSIRSSFSSMNDPIGDGLLEKLINIFVLEPIPSNMRNFSSLSQQLLGDGSNIAGVLAALPDDKKQEIEDTLSRYVHHLPEQDIRRVWAQSVGLLNSDAMLYCEETWAAEQPPLIVDARGMSDGTLRFLAILTALLTRPEGSQLIIEEVDNGLHPSRAALLLKMLKEVGYQRQIDVLVTTHNPALLDALEPEMIPFIVVAHRDRETGESKLTPLDDLQNLPKLLASGTLGKLSERGAIERSLSKT